jgi:pimeloyl-ACP methyl ester carboxylesterase
MPHTQPLEDIYSEYTRGWIELDKARISYLYSESSGPWLILIPGSFSDASQWVNVIKNLNKNISLVLVELRGHGESWPPPVNGSVAQFAQDVLAVANTLRINKFFVGGHSIGGMISLEIGRVQPGRVEGIISIEGWTRHEAEQTAFGGLKNNTLTNDQRACSLISSLRVTRNWTDQERKDFRLIWKQWDGYDFLLKTTLPILELWGDRNLPNRPTLESLFIPDMENIQVHWITEGSHDLPLQRPREIAKRINELVTNVIK